MKPRRMVSIETKLGGLGEPTSVTDLIERGFVTDVGLILHHPNGDVILLVEEDGTLQFLQLKR